jgi:hypothetical protein
MDVGPFRCLCSSCYACFFLKQKSEGSVKSLWFLVDPEFRRVITVARNFGAAPALGLAAFYEEACP